MLRKLAIAIAASGAMMSATYVHALGMGDIELESALNQPLDAQIKLIKAGELEDWEIKPDLASSDEFQKSGIEHVFFLNNVKFEVERVGDDVYIKLSTNQPVVEPFLNFLVQVDWPNGRLLREYTLLLDPPVFSEDEAQSVSAPVVEDEFEDDFTQDSDMEAGGAMLPGTGGIDDLADIPDVEGDDSEYLDESEEQVAEESDISDLVDVDDESEESDISDLADVEDESVEDELLSEESVEDELLADEVMSESSEVESEPLPKTYTVQNDDTLWEVALRTRPNRSVSPQQAMLAIQDLNPDAFIGGNINRLKKNQVLRIPDEEQIRARNFKESVSEVAIQNQFLSTQKAQLDATSKSQAIEREDELSGAELKLLAGGAATTDSERGASGEVMAQAAGSQSKLDNELSLALEDLDKSKRDSLELNARLDLLEDQIKTLQRIISLKDEQMVALQAGFAKSGDDQSVDPRQAELDQLAAAAKANENAKTDLNFASSDKTISADKPVNQVTPDTVNSEQVKKPNSKFTALPEVAEDEPFDAMAFAMENPPIMGGVLGALLLALFGVNFVRKRKEKQAEESVADMSNFEGLDPLDGPDGQLGADFDDEFSDLEISGGEDLSDDDLVTRVDDFGEPETGLPDALDDTQESTDVLGEVEIYIAYDRFDQARSLLEKTLQSQPARMDLRIKLMEVLVAMGDHGSIASHYDYVVAQGSVADQEKASQFREVMGGDDSLGDHALDMDGELDLEISSDSDVGDLDFNTGELDDGDLNFDLDGLGLDETPSSNESLDSLELDSENSLDFETATLDDVSLDLDSASENNSDDNSSLDLDFTEDLGSDDLEFDLGLDDNSSETEAADLDLEMDLSELDDGLSSPLDDTLDDLNELELSLDAEESLILDSDVGENDDLSLELSDELPVLEDNDVALDEGFDLTLDAELDDTDGLSFDLVDEDLPVLSDDTQVDLQADSQESAELDDISLDLDMDLGIEEDTAVDSSLQDLDDLSKELDAELLDFDSVAEVDSLPEEAEVAGGDLDLSDLDADLDFLSGTDESETKLDLARAYIDMDDKDGAKEILQEVLEEGTDKQKQDAGSLLDTLA